MLIEQEEIPAEGHVWQDATYTEPRTCAVCGATEGEPLPDPGPLTVIIAANGKSAQITGDYTGLYARLAISLDNAGESGLYLAQCRINADGSITIPSFNDVAGLKVTGISVALVPTTEDIISRLPAYEAMDYLYC